MDEVQFNKLVSKLDIITKLVAFNALQGKILKDQVITLHSMGIPLSDIANIVGKKPTDIGQYLYRKKIKK